MEASLAASLVLGLLFAPGSSAQGADGGTTASSSTLQPWLVGLAAVLGFLGVAFTGALINRCFFSNTRADKDEEGLVPITELRTTPNVYENKAVDTADEEPSPRAKVEDEKLTSM